MIWIRYYADGIALMTSATNCVYWTSDEEDLMGELQNWIEQHPDWKIKDERGLLIEGHRYYDIFKHLLVVSPMNTYCVCFRHTPKGHAGYGYGVHVKSPDTFHLRENIYRYIEERIGPIQLKQHNSVALVDGSSIRIYDTVYEQRLGTGVYRFDLVEVKYW